MHLLCSNAVGDDDVYSHRPSGHGIHRRGGVPESTLLHSVEAAFYGEHAVSPSAHCLLHSRDDQQDEG